MGPPTLANDDVAAAIHSAKRLNNLMDHEEIKDDRKKKHRMSQNPYIPNKNILEPISDRSEGIKFTKEKIRNEG